MKGIIIYKLNIKKILYTGILLAGSAATALLSGCASTQSLDRLVLNNLNPRTAAVMQENEQDESEKHSNIPLDKLVRFEMNYQKASRNRLTYKEINFWTIGDNEENKEIVDVLNSIDTSTYEEFITSLSGLSEEQIIKTLSALADLAADTIYTDKNDKHSKRLRAKYVHYLIKEYSFKGKSSDERVFCKHILNYVSETAKRAGLPEAVTVSCNTKKERHVISAVWLSNGDIRIIDYGDIYAGNSDLELMFKEYQRIQKTLCISHRIHRNENHLFTFTTDDGENFYDAISYPDSSDLKNIFINQHEKKSFLEFKIGDSENSVSCNKDNLFCKIGHIQGADKPAYWDAPFFQIGVKDYKKNNLKYNLNLLAVPLKNHTITGISGNLIYKKKIISEDSRNLTAVLQLATLLDLTALKSGSTPINENKWISLTGGICQSFDKKIDFYALLTAEPEYFSILSNELKPIISEARIGCRFASEETSINPEYLYEKQADTLNLETSWKHKNLKLGFALSTSDSRYKRIWPDKNSMQVSAEYSSDNLSIGGSAEYSKKNWISDERYDFKVNVWINKSF